jgi:type IV secretory pathway TraG/TraD family ATPase VirD4
MLRAMIASLMAFFEDPSANMRLIVFDPKGEFFPLLHDIAPWDMPVYLVKPTDSRSVALDYSDFISDYARLQQFVYTIAPNVQGESQPFFRDLARTSYRDVTDFVARVGRGLGFRDTVNLTATMERMKLLIGPDPYAKATAAQYLHGGRSSKDVVSTLHSCLDKFRVVGACFEHCKKKISVKEILDTRCIVVLGWDNKVSEALLPFYQQFFRTVGEELLARNDPTQWCGFLIDEAPLLKGVDFLPIATLGRSGEVCLLLTIQDVSHFHATIGKENTSTLTGNLHHQVHLQANSDAAAQFSSDSLGVQEVLRRHVSQSSSRTYGQNGVTTTNGVTTSEQIVKRELVTKDEFKYLPLAKLTGRVKGWAKLPHLGGSYPFDIPVSELLRGVPEKLEVPINVPRPAEHFRLEPLNLADLKRLGLDHIPGLAETL